jgi:hypothetical protein
VSTILQPQIIRTKEITKAKHNPTVKQELQELHAIPKIIKPISALNKALVNLSSLPNQGSYQLDFPKFLPLDGCVDNIWAQKNGLRGQRQKISSK